MSKAPKLIVTEGPFEVYRAGHVLIVQRDGEFFCNLRKADRGFSNPAHWVAEILRCEAESADDAARAEEDRRQRVNAYLAERAERRDQQPTLI